MPRPIEKVRHPTAQALLTIDGARRELARVYCETKRELIPSDVGARLANMLGQLIGSAKSQVMEQRLDALEAKLAEAETVPPRLIWKIAADSGTDEATVGRALMKPGGLLS